jgi:hypothetical protein
LRLEFVNFDPPSLAVADEDENDPEEYEIAITNERMTTNIPGSKERHTYVRLGDASELKPKVIVPPDVSLPSFNGTSEKLRHTAVLPALDAALPDRKSAIWCATLPLAWQRLEKDVVKAPLLLAGAEELCRSLSSSPSPGLLPEHYYAAAGFLKDGIMEQIRRDLLRRFPQAPLPDVSNVSEQGAVAYGYLEVALKYPFAFKNSDLHFDGSDGSKKNVKAFGIREQDKDRGETTFRGQVRVLFREQDEFAVDLSEKSQPYQIVLACVQKKKTLQATVVDLEKRVRAAREKGKDHGLSQGAVLLVPTMSWKIDHHFRELEGKQLANPKFPLKFMALAQQFVQFNLDRRGAVLTSGAALGADWSNDGVPLEERFLFDRPYLIVFKRRGSQEPFFVMWVENAELMQAR